MSPDGEGDVQRASPLRWLLVLPFAAMMWVPSYNRVEPTLWSMPFFYWYQLLWVLLSAVLVGLVYVAERKS